MTALAYPDGLRRVRPARVIRTYQPAERRTAPIPYLSLVAESNAWREEFESKS